MVGKPLSHQVRIRGKFAMFTNPLSTSERWSYDVMTPPAAEGILEAILWHPGMRWVVEEIGILAPIAHISIRTNEGKNVATGPKPCYIEDDRTQRSNLLLRDVDYYVKARIAVNSHDDSCDLQCKYDQMFIRRMNKGQYYREPYLGCMDYPAEVLWYKGDPPIIKENRDFGMMNCGYWTSRNGKSEYVPAFWHAKMSDGIIEVPDLRGVSC